MFNTRFMANCSASLLALAGKRRGMQAQASLRVAFEGFRGAIFIG
jgi:hypothetical protein